MTTIKPYQTQVEEQKTAQAYNTHRFSPDEFGAAKWRAVEKVGADMRNASSYIQQGNEARDKRILEEKIRESRTTVRVGINSARQSVNEQVDGDFLSRTGFEAKGVYDEAVMFHEKQKAEWLDKFKTPYEKELFEQNFDSYAEANLRRVKNHQVKQMELANKSATQIQIQNTIKDMVSMKADWATSGEYDNLFGGERVDNGFLENMIEGLEAVEELHAGQAPEVIKAAKEEYIQSAHKAVLNSFIGEKKVGSAKKYYEANKDDIYDTKYKADFKEKVDTINLNQDSSDLADEVMQLYPNEPDKWVGAVDAMTKGKADLRAKTLSWISTRKSILAQQKADNLVRTKDGYAGRITKARNLEDALKIADEVMEITNLDNRAELSSQLRVFAQNRFKTAEAKKAEKQKAEVKTVTKQEKIAEDIKKRLTRAQGQEALSSMYDAIDDTYSRADYRLSEDFIEFELTDALASGAITTEEYKAVLNYNEAGGQFGDIKKSAVESIIQDYLGKDEKPTPALTTFVLTRIQKSIVPGEKMTQKEIDEVVAKAVIDAKEKGEVLSGSWFKSNPNMDFASALATGQAEKWRSFDIPEEARTRITAELKKRGKQVSEDAISLVYTAEKIERGKYSK